MKILFIGDYSGMHATLASELRRRGHQVTLLSDGGAEMNTPCNICLPRTRGWAGGVKYLFSLFSLLPQLKGYDAVQLINPCFLSLKPAKLRYFFRELKRDNGQVCLSLAGSDHFYVRAATDGHTFRFSDYRIGFNRTRFATEYRLQEEMWLHPGLEDFTRFVYDGVDAAMSGLYEYHVASLPELGDKLHYTGLPVDLDLLRPGELDLSGPVRVLVGCKSGREIEKGTDRLLPVMLSLEAEMKGEMVVEQARDLSWRDYMDRVRRAHVVVDQLYAYTPALNALQSMALGRVAASGAQPEYYDFIGEHELRPIIPLAPDDDALRDSLKTILADRDEIRRRAEQSRLFVQRHNDVKTVAEKYLEIWNSKC